MVQEQGDGKKCVVPLSYFCQLSQENSFFSYEDAKFADFSCISLEKVGNDLKKWIMSGITNYFIGK